MKQKNFLLPCFLVTLLLGLPGFRFLHAQEDTELTDYQAQVIPSSPTAASLGEYAYAPVDLSRGMINVSVPIWEIKGNDLSLPISLNYRPGVKTYEISEYTGHGWSLLAGGVITRQIIDKPDFLSAKRMDTVNFNSHLYTYDEILDVYTGYNVDTSPDIFSYNFNGYSGRFAFGHDLETIHFLDEHRNWKVTAPPSAIQGPYRSLHIITEDGTQYRFEELEETILERDGGALEEYVTSWYLTEIRSSRTNERIEFSYYSEMIGGPGTRLLNNRLALTPGTQDSQLFPDADISSYAYRTRRLEEINFYKNGVSAARVVFEKSTERRKDTSHEAYPLKRISIYENNTALQPVKYFDLDIDQVNDERLFLRSIQEFSGDGQLSKPPYQFMYYSERGLPSRFSGSTRYDFDHWGYHSSEGTEFPYHEMFPRREAKSKDASFPEAQYGSLRSITYPTGGKNVYTYEPNEYNEEEFIEHSTAIDLEWAGQWRERGKIHPAANPFISTFQLHESRTVSIDACLVLSKRDEYKIFTLLSELRDYSIDIVNTSTGENVFNMHFEVDVDVLLWRNNTIIAFDDFSKPIYGKCLDEAYDLTLPAGTYEMRANFSSIENEMKPYESRILVDAKVRSVEKVNVIKQGAGIRIANQRLLDHDNRVIRSINYEYDEFDTEGRSLGRTSGIITEKPIDGYYVPLVQGRLSEFIGRSGNIAYPAVSGTRIEGKTRFVLFSKSPSESKSWVAYTQVKEEEVGNGFKIHEYYGIGSDRRNFLQPFLLHPPGAGDGGTNFIRNFTSFGWPGNGNLILNPLWNKQKRIVTFEDDGINPRRMVKEETFDYDVKNRGRLYSIEIGRMLQHFVYGLSYYPIQVPLLNYSEEKVWETGDAPGSNPEIAFKKTVYKYGSRLVNVPSQILRNLSPGKTSAQKFKYSVEYSRGLPFNFDSNITVDYLEDRNIIEPLETQRWTLTAEGGSPKLISNHRVIYSEEGGFVRPSKIYEFADRILDDYYSTPGVFSPVNQSDDDQHISFDISPDGEIEATRSTDGIASSFVYGYDQRLPVVKIDHDGSVTIQSSIRNNVTNRQFAKSTDREAIKSDIQFLQNSVVNQLALPATSGITLYTYHPVYGMTSVTDGNGVTTFFEYDTLGRLINIYDQDENPVSSTSYEYNFR